MRLRLVSRSRDQEYVQSFRQAFTDSEGADEGDLIAGLVEDLLSGTAPNDIYAIAAEAHGTLIAGCVFTRLRFENDTREIFLLSPVAVVPTAQGTGVGQTMIGHGLSLMREAGVDVAMTYGDPNFYNKVGFQPVSEADAMAPFPLRQPEGWLGLALKDKSWSPLKGRSTCVPALANPVFW